MMIQDQKGFTIIEVILFLALSSAFLLIAFMGIRGRTANVQFSDSMRSLYSFLVSEQNKVVNGVNSSTTLPSGCASGVLGPGESNKCILMGRIVTFGIASSTSELSVVETNAMFGDKKPPSGTNSTDIDKIIDANPRADSTLTTYNIEWDTFFNPLKSTNDTGTKIDKIGWFRSPDSTSIVPVMLGEPSTGISVNKLSGFNPYKKPGAFMGDDVNAKLCFTGVNGQFASISFNKNTHLTLEFDDQGCKP